MTTFAEKLLIRELQKKYFGKEYKLALQAKIEYLDKGLAPLPALKGITSLDLFMDDHNLLRCKGRLQNVSFPWDTIHPILLPNNSSATRAFIRYLHISNHHIGCSHLLSKLREKFWVVKGLSLIHISEPTRPY